MNGQCCGLFADSWGLFKRQHHSDILIVAVWSLSNWRNLVWRVSVILTICLARSHSLFFWLGEERAKDHRCHRRLPIWQTVTKLNCTFFYNWEHHVATWGQLASSPCVVKQQLLLTFDITLERSIVRAHCAVVFCIRFTFNARPILHNLLHACGDTWKPDWLVAFCSFSTFSAVCLSSTCQQTGRAQKIPEEFRKTNCGLFVRDGSPLSLLSASSCSFKT